MIRRLKNFEHDVDREALLDMFLSQKDNTFYSTLAWVDLHPTLRLLVYLRAMEILGPDGPDSWEQQLLRHDVEYQRAIKAYKTQKYVSHFVGDPLQAAGGEAGNAYRQRHQIIQLEQQVWKDVNRLFSGLDFFADQAVRQRVHRLTTLYCHAEGGLVYRQGMHEVAAFCYYIAAQSVAQLPTDGTMVHHHGYLRLLGADSVAYQLLRQFMGRLGLSKLYSDDQFMAATIGSFNDEYLARRDPALYEHITQLNIEGFHIIRFYRLLFCREVAYQLVPRFWDLVVYLYRTICVANGVQCLQVACLNNICYTMYEDRRQSLLASDYNGIMRIFSTSFLQDYTIGDLEQFIQRVIRNAVPAEDRGLISGHSSGLAPVESQIKCTPYQQICYYLIRSLRDVKALVERQDAAAAIAQLDELTKLLQINDPLLFQDVTQCGSLGIQDVHGHMSEEQLMQYVLERLIVTEKQDK